MWISHEVQEMENGISVHLDMLCCHGNVLVARSPFLSEDNGASEVSKKDKVSASMGLTFSRGDKGH